MPSSPDLLQDLPDDPTLISGWILRQAPVTEDGGPLLDGIGRMRAAATLGTSTAASASRGGAERGQHPAQGPRSRRRGRIRPRPIGVLLAEGVPIRLVFVDKTAEHASK